jgi:glycosyltransferase involved in cell wall biosynthesis
MKTSVIIPVHNREKFIATAIRSLLRQRGDVDLDIIVVDDGSTDRTTEIVTALSRDAPCIRLFRQPKAGVARARNAGLAQVPADAELVTFLDSDDISVAGRFAAEVPLFREDPTLEMAYSMMTLADDVDDATFTPKPTATTCTLRGISLTTALFRTSTINSLGGLDESFRQAEDWEFLLRFFERSSAYRLLDNVSIIYRRHGANTTCDVLENRRLVRRALLLSAQRRRRDPSLLSIPNIFDIGALYSDENYAPLR